MKEVTYKDWLKNPIPRMMWVWDNKEEDKIKRKVIYFVENKDVSHPVIALSSDGTITANYKHCAEKVREMNIPCKRHRSEVKLSVHSCRRTREAHDMIKYLSKSFTKASIARVFGYSAERIRQICADNEE